MSGRLVRGRVPNLGIIVACAENGVIGRAGALPWNIAEDRQHFFDSTRGGVLVHGRRVLVVVRLSACCACAH